MSRDFYVGQTVRSRINRAGRLLPEMWRVGVIKTLNERTVQVRWTAVETHERDGSVSVTPMSSASAQWTHRKVLRPNDAIDRLSEIS